MPNQRRACKVANYNDKDREGAFRKGEDEMRQAVGIVFLLLQLASMVHAQFVPSRWICWAPNDYAIWYRLDVRVNGHSLSPEEIENRYQLPGESVYQNPPQNIKDIIRQYEQTYGRKDQTEVNLLYREAGGPPQQWQWPPH